MFALMNPIPAFATMQLLEGNTVTPSDMVTQVGTAVTSNVSFTSVIAAVAAIIGLGIGMIIAWNLGRKGYRYVVNALKGKAGKI